MTIVTILGLIKALLQNLPLVLNLLQSIENYRLMKEGEGKGRTEAVAEALQISNDQLQKAMQARAEADQAHAAHPTDDGGFDPDGRRD